MSLQNRSGSAHVFVGRGGTRRSSDGTGSHFRGPHPTNFVPRQSRALERTVLPVLQWNLGFNHDGMVAKDDISIGVLVIRQRTNMESFVGKKDGLLIRNELP